MFSKLISQGMGFRNQVLNFFSNTNPKIDTFDLDKAGEFMMHTRAWYWISECNLRKKEWKLNNQEKVKISQIKDYQTNGKKRNKEKYNKIKSNPVEYLKILMRRRIRGILKTKNLNKKLSTKDIVGCEYSELKLYLEERFTEGMSWDNQGCWHIDHKTPLSSAKNEVEIYKLCHYTNLQPLWAIYNLRKGNKQ
jgi:hypothetical protein